MHIRVTLYGGYLIVLRPFYLVCILYCGCFDLFYNMWVCACVGVLVMCVLVFIVFFIVSFMYIYSSLLLVYVLLPPRENATAVNNNNSNSNNNLLQMTPSCE